MSLIRICESKDFVVDYDKDRGMYRVSVFKDNHFQDEYWFDAYEEKELDSDVREKIANAVEDKMAYMCGCRNCIEKITMIIKGDVKPFKSQCKNCGLECDARIT